MIKGIENLKDGYLEGDPEDEKRCYLCGTSAGVGSELYRAKISYQSDGQKVGSSRDIWLCHMCYETLSEYAE